MDIVCNALLQVALFILLIRVYFYIASKYGIVDIPNHRSSHDYLTIRGAGILFPIGVGVGLLCADGPLPVYFIAGLAVLSVVSFADDVKGLSSTLRFIVHLISGALLAYQLWPIYQSWPIAILICLAVTVFVNGFNFMDGINGITGLYGISLLMALGIVDFALIDFVDSGLLLAVFGALVVFGYFNFRKKARCFAGDVGSVSLAFFIAFLLILLIMKSASLYYVIFVAVYVIDFGATLVHRLLLGEKISQPHRKHLYQLMANEKGFSHLLVSAGFAGVQLLVNVMLVLIVKIGGSVLLSYTFALVVFLVLLTIYLSLRKRFFALSLQR